MAFGPALAACTSARSTPGSGGSAGASALGVEPFGLSADGSGPTPIVDGGDLELWAAPQGGHVSRIGARVTGLSTNTAELVARLSDLATDTVLAESSRTAPMLPVEGEPGVSQPDPSSIYSLVHLPLCPNNDGFAVDSHELRLELSVTELYGSFATGSAVRRVTPRCDGPPGPELDFCRCECGPSYGPGGCGGDGGDLSDSGTGTGD